MAESIIAKLRKGASGHIFLDPATPVDTETLLAMPLDRDGKFEVTFPRNLQFHKKFFVLLGVIFDYMDEETRGRYNIHNVKQLLIRLKLDLGLYTLYISAGGGMVPEGTPIYEPDSISFGKMDEVSFGKFYKSVIGVAIGKYTTNQTEASMMEAANAVMRFE